MKPLLAAFLLTLAANSAVALDIITTDGARFRQCEGVRAEADSLRFVHAEGTAHIPLTRLSPALQSQFFTPAVIEASRAREAAARPVDIVTTEGEHLRNCTFVHTEGWDLRFIHEGKSSRVYVLMLPAEIQKKYFTAQEVEAARLDASKRIAAMNAGIERKNAEKAANEKLTKEAGDQRAAAIMAERERAETKARQEREATNRPPTEAQKKRAAQYSAMKDGMWTWVYGKISTLTKTGQILTQKDGSPIHVTCDLGLTRGEEHGGYYLRAENYEFIGADGTRERLRNYVPLAAEDAAFVKRMDAYYGLLMEISMARSRHENTADLAARATAMHATLKNEGVPLKDDTLQQRLK